MLCHFVSLCLFPPGVNSARSTCRTSRGTPLASPPPAKHRIAALQHRRPVGGRWDPKCLGAQWGHGHLGISWRCSATFRNNEMMDDVYWILLSTQPDSLKVKIECSSEPFSRCSLVKMTSSALFCHRKILQRCPNTSKWWIANTSQETHNEVPQTGCRESESKSFWGHRTGVDLRDLRIWGANLSSQWRIIHLGGATKTSRPDDQKMGPYQWKDVKAGVEVRYAPLSSLACHLNGAKKSYKILSA